MAVEKVYLNNFHRVKKYLKKFYKNCLNIGGFFLVRRPSLLAKAQNPLRSKTLTREDSPSNIATKPNLQTRNSIPKFLL